MKRPHPGLHYLTVAVHVCFGLSIFHRPYLPLILPSYARFDDIMPWLNWGWCALLVGAWMALFASDFRLWFPRLRWVRHLSQHPPRWARGRRGD